MNTLTRLLRFVRPYWWGTLVTMVLIFAITILKLGPAWMTKLIIDDAIPKESLTLVGVYLIGMIGVSGGLNLLGAVQLYLEQWVGQRVIFDVRGALYDHLQSQSMSFYDANQTGQLMSRVTNDVSQVQFFLTQGLSRLVTTFITIAANLAVMFWLDWHLTLISLVVVPLILWFQKYSVKVWPLFRKRQELQASLNVVIQENVAGIKLVKAYGREEFEADRFNAVNEEMRSVALQSWRVFGVTGPGQEFATYLSAIIIITVGGLRVMEGHLTIGDLSAFYAYVLTMFAPVRFLVFINQMALNALASGERIFEILDTPLDVMDRPGAVRLEHVSGSVTMENVSFAYGKGAPLLRDISIDVPPGKTLALVGPSGSGKTTLVNLIPRFYDPTTGTVQIDGHDVRDIQVEALRAQMGMVMQETFLFNASIRENIAYGRADASIEEIEAAARAANAHPFISEMPNGYDTEIGERGTRLSGGQRQRLAIARAILVDPRILILDEATSSVDNQTDYLIRQALDSLMEGRTTIVIAHRLSTVQRAHQIAVMEAGRITARGTHAELLRSSPLYAHLADIQFQLATEASASAGPATPVAQR
ncbi:MAG: ABC transporter ATP-binding protein [Chloroflexi bacterium]|nr:ABC transporter ATP-binding protein [Chloroflexota bacterium]RLT29698.1 MAG: ABC transporter ATP-binding protein [Chloroflexota bacterium]